MANATGAFGLRPVRHINGTPYNGGTVPCNVGADDTTALFIGDPVLLSTDLSAQSSTYPTAYNITASAGTTTTLILGCVVSFSASPTNLTLQYRAASTTRVVNCCMDPTVIYHIRGDGGGTPLVSWVGANANMIATAAGSTITGISGFHLDEGTTDGPAATQADPLHIVGLANIPNNEFGDNAIWEVMLNAYDNNTGRTAGVLST